uniref:Uncharacterized protein n=1 Tax=Panagrolaimus sp. ES5 TaxID=591445 RepID=A0AC34F680_9BILA
MGRNSLAEVNEKLTYEKDALQKASCDLLAKIERVETRLTEEDGKKNVNEQIERLTQEISRLHAELGQSQKQLKEVLNFNDFLQNEKKTSTKEIGRLNDVIYSLSNSGVDRKVHEDAVKELKQKDINYKNLQAHLHRTQKDWKAAEQLNRAKFDEKISECNKMEEKLKASAAKINELQSKHDRIVQQNENNTLILENQIKQLQQTVETSLEQNGKVTAELEEIKHHLNKMMYKRNSLAKMAKLCTIKSALFVKQKKAVKEAKMITEEIKRKKEENVKITIKADLSMIHEECEKKIDKLTADLMKEKVKSEAAEKKLKEHIDKKQKLVCRAQSANVNMDEVKEILEIVSPPAKKRQRTSDQQQPLQHSSSAPSTSKSLMQQPQQQNYVYDNNHQMPPLFYPHYFPQQSYHPHPLLQQYTQQNFVYHHPQQQHLHHLNNNVSMGQPRPMHPGMNFNRSSAPQPPPSY